MQAIAISIMGAGSLIYCGLIFGAQIIAKAIRGER